MGGWSDGSDGAWLQRMPKVAHVHSRSRQGIKRLLVSVKRPQKFLPGEYLMICDKCVVIARIYKVLGIATKKRERNGGGG